MRRREKAFWLVALPLAVMMAAADARLSAQQGLPRRSLGEGGPPVTEQPMASRSGIELGSLDKTADPCTDFYQFACGGWLAKHPLPPDQPRYGRFEELQDRNNEIVHDILETAAKTATARDENTAKVGDYYATCMSEAVIEKKGLAPLQPELDRIASLESKDDLPGTVGHLHAMGIGPFFGFGSIPDFKDATQIIAAFGQGGMGMPDRDYYLKDDANSVKLRDEYVQHVSRMLELAGAAPDRAAAGSKAVMQIETALARHALDRTSRRVPANIYHKMTMDEARQLTPAFSLAAYFKGAEVPDLPTANVTEPDFMKGVDQVIAATSLDDLKTYLRWHLIHGNAPLLPKAFVDENFAFYGKTLTGAQEQRARWKRCTDFTNGDLGEAVGRAYVDRTFGGEGKARTLQMVQAIEAALHDDIQQITWMSDATKQQAEIKLRAVANKIGYPDKWRDYSALQIIPGDAIGNSLRANVFEFRRQLAKIGKPVDKTEWLMTPPTVNAYYYPPENNINFPAGILQPPFFNKAADDAVNFGAAGAVVGHELTHGFDDQGRQFDAQGNLRDWWTPADGKAFEDRAACIANQYGGYTAVADVKVNGKLTLGENIGDNGGVRLGWMALMEKMKAARLPDADGYTPEQRFFIGWGQMWCENRTDAVARMHAATNPHSPGRFRTIGVVSNMPEFQKAFSCPANAKMVNQPMCRVW